MTGAIMKTSLWIVNAAIVSWALFGSLGCTRSILFYETEKFSLTLEGKSDATEPVSGNLGIKERIVAVVPRRSVAPSTQPAVASASAPQDAVSMVSYFDLSQDPGNKSFLNNPVTIQTAFLTGR